MFCAPHHMLSVTPSLQKLHSIWNGIFGGPCTPVHVNHEPPQTKTKILHSTWDGIFCVFCAPHHMLSETPNLQKLHSIWNGIFGGPCAGIHVNHVPPQTKTKILHSTWNGIFMCSVHHTTCYQWPLAYKHSITLEMAYSVGHVPLYTLTMYPPHKNKNTS